MLFSFTIFVSMFGYIGFEKAHWRVVSLDIYFYHFFFRFHCVKDSLNSVLITLILVTRKVRIKTLLSNKSKMLIC